MTDIHNLQDIYTLMKRYFEGKTSEDEDGQLADFVRADKSNRALFRQWEKEWEHAYEVSGNTKEEWELMDEALEDAARLQKAKRHRSRVIRMRLLQAAAMVAFIAMSSFVTWLLLENRNPDYYVASVPYGSKMKLMLPDSSVVWLNAGSRLTYASNFNKKNRRVSLEGEGYFEVTRHEGKKFVVHTSGYEVTVRGTHFNIQAYKDDPFISTSLLSGEVEIDRAGERLVLQPGEVATLDAASGILSKSRMGNEPNAWISNRLNYNAISMGNLARILSRTYAVRIHVLSPELYRKKFTISLRNKETINDVISTLQSIALFKVERKGKDIYIKSMQKP
ncbi:ferric-dicitrate binding protein FerR, regulates iron transport through sigma-19 [Prevotella sp. KH2C16]|nr:ferric-dicitrate binding protein FerR, regulates iron transport through sigma-19 [Prevotella sp. KH2C16]